MKAAVVERPGVLKVKDVPDPRPGEYDVLCKLLYGATCTGTDMHILAGTFPRPLDYPLVLGHESIGEVIDVGKRVRNFKSGDIVCRVGALSGDDNSWGGFAEYGIARDHGAMREDGLPRKAWDKFRVNQLVPRQLDTKAATMIITWRETLSYITRMGVSRGARVLVIGSGGTGLAFLSHSKNIGADHVAVIGNPARQEIAIAAGATTFFDYTQPDLLKKLSTAYPMSKDFYPWLCGGGFDFIIDSVGKQSMLEGVLPFLNSRGTIGIYGIDDFGRCAINPIQARGTFTYYNSHHDEAESHDEVIRLMHEGSLDASMWLDLESPFDLSDIGDAFTALGERRIIKALIKL
jgi:L-iditol 2-dehydrogenase